jgi:hypothetical protein
MSSEHPAAGSSSRRTTLQQLEFIEFKLYWENEACRQDLMEFFGISRPQASILFRRYDEIAPGNLEYDLRSKRYVRSRTFTPKLITPEPEAYFRHLLNSGLHQTDGLGSFSDKSLSFDQVPGIGRRIDPAVLQKIIEAVRRGHGLRILYQSMSAKTPSMRVISPHAFVFDGHRWHVRAYCFHSKSFRDFVLIRIAVIAGREDVSADFSQDREWHERGEVLIGPHPGLSPFQREIIEKDYGMVSGVRRIEMRKALIFYFLQRIGLLREEGRSPQEQQIVLLNREELKLD